MKKYITIIDLTSGDLSVISFSTLFYHDDHLDLEQINETYNLSFNNSNIEYFITSGDSNLNIKFY